MGDAAPRYADDAQIGRGHAAALDARAPRHVGDRGNLSAADAAALALWGGEAKAVSRAAGLSRHRGWQDALHYRRRWLGGGRQIDHGARAGSAAWAVAECA